MLRVKGPPVLTDVLGVPYAVELLLAPIMAALAQCLQVAVIPHERIGRATVRLDVVDYFACLHPTIGKAHHAQGVTLAVVHRAPIPVARIASLAKRWAAVVLGAHFQK